MNQHSATMENVAGKSLLYSRAEQRTVTHSGIFTADPDSKTEVVTTFRAAYVPPKSPGVRLRGIRGELLEKHIAQVISEEIQTEQKPPTPKTDFCSTTQRDFYVKGFVPFTPGTTQAIVHDYKTDQAITFWSENRQRIQGATAAQSLKAPFRKSALFSTPISQRLDEIDLPPEY